MNDLTIIEHNQQRVLTTAQLAEVYKTKTTNIHSNLSNNKERFIEGVHYYLLKGSDLAAFKDSVKDIDLVNSRTPTLILWTHKGASRHCKMLDTDEAWKQFDILENTYFNAQDMYTIPKTHSEALFLAANLQQQIEVQAPLVAFAKTALQSEDSMLVREFAKVCCNDGIETGEKRLYATLRRWGLIMPNSREPYQEYVDRGYFEVILGNHKTDYGTDQHRTTRVLPKGQIYIINRLRKEMGI